MHAAVQGEIELAPLPTSKIQYLIEYPKSPSAVSRMVAVGACRGRRVGGGSWVRNHPLAAAILPAGPTALSVMHWTACHAGCPPFPSSCPQDQQSYILGYLRQFEGALFGPSFTDPATGWRQLANQSSAIDFFLFEVGAPGWLAIRPGWMLRTLRLCSYHLGVPGED